MKDAKDARIPLIILILACIGILIYFISLTPRKEAKRERRGAGLSGSIMFDSIILNSLFSALWLIPFTYRKWIAICFFLILLIILVGLFCLTF